MFGVPIEICLQHMQDYIKHETGQVVKIKPPVTDREIELFEKMYTWLSNKFGL